MSNQTPIVVTQGLADLKASVDVVIANANLGTQVITDSEAAKVAAEAASATSVAAAAAVSADRVTVETLAASVSAAAILVSDVNTRFLPFYKVGKNKIDKSLIRRGFYVSNGQQRIQAGTLYRCTPHIEVEEGKTYFMSGGDSQFGAYFSGTGDTDFVQATSPTGGQGFTVPSGLGITHVVFNITNEGQDDLTWDDTVQLEEGTSATAYEPYVIYFDEDEFNANLMQSYNLLEAETLTHIYQEQDEIHFDLPKANALCENQIRLTFSYDIDAPNAGEGWRLGLIDEINATTKVRVRRLAAGEQDLAIRERNKADFMGGHIHDHTYPISITLTVDGEEVAIDGIGTSVGSIINLQRVVMLTEDGVTNPTVDSVRVTQDLAVTKGVVTMESVAEWIRDVDCVSTFLGGMLSAYRTVSSELVLSAASWEGLDSPYDVSATHSAPKVNTDYIILRGDVGITMGVKWLKGRTASGQCYVSSGSTQNKIYMSPDYLQPNSTASGTIHTAGSITVTKFEYILETLN